MSNADTQEIYMYSVSSKALFIYQVEVKQIMFYKNRSSKCNKTKKTLSCWGHKIANKPIINLGWFYKIIYLFNCLAIALHALHQQWWCYDKQFVLNYLKFICQYFCKLNICPCQSQWWIYKRYLLLNVCLPNNV